MLVLFSYPMILQWFSPQGKRPPVVHQEPVPAEKNDAAEIPEPVLTPAQGPFIQKQVPPALIQYENRFYQMEFSTLGGTLTQLRFQGEPERREITQTFFYEGDPETPGLFGIRLLNEKADLAWTNFKMNRRQEMSGEIFEFSYEKPEDYRIVKRYRLSAEKPVIELEIELDNLSTRERHFPLEFLYSLDHALVAANGREYGDHQRNFEAVFETEKKLETADLGRIIKKGFLLSAPIEWSGILKPYFAILVKPDWKAIAGSAEADKKTIRASLRMEPVSIDPGAKVQRNFLIYAGTQRHETLKSFNLGFESILSRGMLGMFKIWLLVILKFCNQFTHNYGWALILLTLIIKGVFTPLTHISYASSRKMQALQPKTKALQEKYKNDPQKLNKETMELWRRNKVNPMSGCLPMLIQMPILFAMFRLLPEAIELKGAPFIFWIRDLSQPDALCRFPFTIPFLGWDTFNLLPVFMTVSQYAYQKLMPQPGVSSEQAKIFALMPVFFGFICYNMPSGLVLYWTVQNLLSIVHQIFLARIVVDLHHEDRE